MAHTLLSFNLSNPFLQSLFCSKVFAQPLPPP